MQFIWLWRRELMEHWISDLMTSIMVNNGISIGSDGVRKIHRWPVDKPLFHLASTNQSHYILLMSFLTIHHIQKKKKFLWDCYAVMSLTGKEQGLGYTCNLQSLNILASVYCYIVHCHMNLFFISLLSDLFKFVQPIGRMLLYC